MSQRHFLGLDGGGASSRARLVDANGNALAEGQAGPSPPMVFARFSMGDAAAKESLAQAAAFVEATMAALSKPGAKNVAPTGGQVAPFDPHFSPDGCRHRVKPQGDSTRGASMPARKGGA